ncbi:MAG TPA: hypothetical protein VF657_22650 [Actinoplanes sp.]
MREGGPRRSFARLAAVTMLTSVAVSVHAVPARAATAPTLCALNGTATTVSRYNLNGAWDPIRSQSTVNIYGGGFGVVAVNSTLPDTFLKRAGSNTWEVISRPRGVVSWKYQVTDTAVYNWLGPSATSNPVFQYRGPGVSWTRIGGPARTIYAGNYGLFATSPDTGDVYRYLGTPGSWARIGGPGRFAVGNTAVYGLSPDGSGIHQYSGTGASWFQIGGAAFSIYAGGHGLFATLRPDGDLYRYLGTPGAWQRLGTPNRAVHGSIRTVVVTSRAVFAQSSSTGQLWVWEEFDGGGWAAIGGGQPRALAACP